MILAKKVRIYPTKEQEQKLWQSVGTARFIYNYTLAKQEENYKNGGKFINDGVIRKELTQLKKSELTWLNEVSNNITKQSVKDACKAYKRFFKSLANKPKFKSRKKSKPSFYNDPIKLKVKEKKVLIEKVGWIKINEQIPINVKYNNPRITYDNKYWYLSVGIEVNEKKEELTNISLGIDLGLKELAICSDGKIFKNINKTKKVKKLEKRLKQKQRQISRKYEINKIKKEKEKLDKFIIENDNPNEIITEEAITTTILADSVLLGNREYIEETIDGTYVDAEGSRLLEKAPEIMKEIDNEGNLGDIVAIALGTNAVEDPEESLEKIVKDLPKGKKLIFISCYDSRYDQPHRVSQAMKKVSKKYKFITYMPWEELAMDHPEFYEGTDGVHFYGKIEAYDAYNDLRQKAILEASKKEGK